MKTYTCIGYGKKLEFDEMKHPFNIRKKVSIIEKFLSALRKVMSSTEYKNDFENYSKIARAF